jgi:hypothetical protein
MLVRFLGKKMIHDPKEYCSSWPASAHVPEAPARAGIWNFQAFQRSFVFFLVLLLALPQ